MEIPVPVFVLVILVAVAVGALIAWLVVRSASAAALAATGVERDLLRERVDDLIGQVDDLRDVAGEGARTQAAIAPLEETIRRVEQQVGTLERDRTQQYSSLATLLDRVETHTQEVGREARSLASSLRVSSVRGSWGEVQLRRVLEAAGMIERVDFDQQVRRVSRHDADVRPDAVVNLPGDRHLVIDSKAPMSAFLQAQGDGLDPAARSRLMGEHAKAVAQHVRALAAKEYWSAFDDSPEVVLCFIPSESMLASAMAADPSLHETALRQRIVLVTPGSLLAVLRTIAYMWQQDSLTTNARELLALGTELHRRLATLGSHTEAMGRSLAKSVESYNRFVGTLESRVLVTARRLRELGAVDDELPETPTLQATPRPLTALELLDERETA